MHYILKEKPRGISNGENDMFALKVSGKAFTISESEIVLRGKR